VRLTRWVVGEVDKLPQNPSRLLSSSSTTIVSRTMCGYSKSPSTVILRAFAHFQNGLQRLIDEGQTGGANETPRGDFLLPTTTINLPPDHGNNRPLIKSAKQSPRSVRKTLKLFFNFLTDSEKKGSVESPSRADNLKLIRTSCHRYVGS